MRIQAREHAARIALVNLEAVVIAENFARLDVALGVVVVVAGLRVDAAHRANHFGSKQNILHRDHGVEQINARLVVDTGVKENIAQQMFFQQRLLEFLRQATETAPVVRHSAAAVRDQKLQSWKVFEQITGQALHEGRGVSVQVMRSGGVETRVAAGAHMDHGRDVVLHHFFVDGVPVFVGEWRRSPVPPRGVWVQVDAHIAILLDALDQLGDASGWVHAGGLGQHGRRHKVLGEQLRHAKTQLIANGRPSGRHIEVANVVGHETGARAEDGDVRAALFHQTQLIGLDGFAQFVVADFQV